jgi:hypothetical protein
MDPPMQKTRITPIKKKITAETEIKTETVPKINIMKRILSSDVSKVQVDRVGKELQQEQAQRRKQEQEQEQERLKEEKQQELERDERARLEAEKEEQERERLEAEKEEQERQQQLEEGAQSQDESQVDIHPKLQEILQYLADDDHVTIIKTSYLENIERKLQVCTDGIESLLMIRSQNPCFEQDIMTYLGRIDDQLTDIHARMQNVTVTLSDVSTNDTDEPKVDELELNESTTTMEHTPENASHAHTQQAYIQEHIQELPTPELTLADLIRQYNDSENGADGSVATQFNQIFDATFIYNYTGKAEKCAKYLTDLGINNCIVIDTPIPKGYDTNRKANCYLADILEISRELNYRTINVIADFLYINKLFFDTLVYIFNDVQLHNWDLLQYCCSDHMHQPNYGVDWEYYLRCNPDLKQLGIDTEQRAAQHYRDKGCKQGRVGKCELAPTQSSNILAFAMRNSIFDKMTENLERANQVRQEIPLFDFSKIALMTVPNLFIVPNTPAASRISLKWHAGSYESM